VPAEFVISAHRVGFTLAFMAVHLVAESISTIVEECFLAADICAELVTAAVVVVTCGVRSTTAGDDVARQQAAVQRIAAVLGAYI
jgi:exoribonuclease II